MRSRLFLQFGRGDEARIFSVVTPVGFGGNWLMQPSRCIRICQGLASVTRTLRHIYIYIQTYCNCSKQVPQVFGACKAIDTEIRRLFYCIGSDVFLSGYTPMLHKVS